MLWNALPFPFPKPENKKEMTIHKDYRICAWYAYMRKIDRSIAALA